jgi:hypothetical protein
MPTYRYKRVLWKRKGRRKHESRSKIVNNLNPSGSNSRGVVDVAIIRETTDGEFEAEYRDEGTVSEERSDGSISLKKHVKFRSKQESIIPASRFINAEFEETDDIEYEVQSLPVSNSDCSSS